MNPPGDTPTPWSTRRLAAIVGLITCAHLWAIYHFDTNPPPVLRTSTPGTVFRIFPGVISSTELALKFFTLDPTLFDEPNANGFSGPAWLAIEQPDYRLPVWTEPPRYLSLDPNSLGKTLSGFLHDKGFPVFDLLPKEEPTPSVLGLYIPPELPCLQSRLSIEGNVSRLEMLTQPNVPAWPSSDVLPSTRIGISVNEQGLVTVAFLVDRSTNAAANAAALDIARNLRFAPTQPHRPADRPANDSQIDGTVVFRWASTPATNSPPVRSAL